MVSPAFWRGRRVFLTGHTGFKGSWLASWLAELGALTTGYALKPPTSPNLYDCARIGQLLSSHIGDIRDLPELSARMHEAAPEVLFHLAAQPLVGEGYRDPLGTFATNVMGTANVLECARQIPSLRSIVVITTDKCYANDESATLLREDAPLGGYDPYSSSKACAELVSAAYRTSFLAQDGKHLATARAGNVIGGGDWAEHRLVPDLLRAFAEQRPAILRNPQSIRPWQHVLEPLNGYLLLAEALHDSADAAGAWNFGPPEAGCVRSGELADLFADAWPGPASWQHQPSNFPHEATNLRLDAEKARQQLKWLPKWSLTETVRHTVDWHCAWLGQTDMQEFCRHQIRLYQSAHS